MMNDWILFFLSFQLDQCLRCQSKKVPFHFQAAQNQLSTKGGDLVKADEITRADANSLDTVIISNGHEPKNS